jgi:putative ABC transport system permease protein
MQEGAPAPSEWFVAPQTFTKGGLAALDSYVFVNAAPGADLDAVRSDLRAIVADLPTVTVKDPQGFADEQKKQINQFLYLIYALLGLSVVIAVLGVINTLALSVIERTREVGLLRAIGVSRRQLRTVIRLESIVIAVFGALLGIALGVAFGVGLMVALEDQGLTEIVVPWVSLLVFVLAAALVGVVAAVFPARRAAKLDVLRAITAE